MITITRTCDACKKVVEKKDQLWNVAIGAACHPDSPDRYSVGKKYTAQWCRPCMEARGLCCQYPRKDPPAPEPTATLDSLIREIVQQEPEE